MDPKQSSQLDPALQQAYDRVMGTNVSAPADSATPGTPTPVDPTATTPPAPSDTPTTTPSPADPSSTPVPDPNISAQTPTDTTPLVTPTTDVPSSPVPTTDNPVTPAPDMPTIPADPSSTPPVSDVPPVPAPEEVPTIVNQEVVETPAPTPNVSMENTASVKPQAFVGKKGMKISPVILAVGGVAFLVVYTLVWVKVFNLQLPFLPQ